MIIFESRKVRKFLKRLRVDIYDRIAMLRPSSYAEVLEHAQLVENLISARHQCIIRICNQQPQPQSQQSRRKLLDLVSSNPR